MYKLISVGSVGLCGYMLGCYHQQTDSKLFNNVVSAATLPIKQLSIPEEPAVHSSKSAQVRTKYSHGKMWK